MRGSLKRRIAAALRDHRKRTGGAAISRRAPDSGSERSGVEPRGNAEKLHEFLAPSWTRETPSLWPSVRAKIAAAESGSPAHGRAGSRPAIRGWGWAAAGLAAMAISGGAYLLFRPRPVPLSAIARSEAEGAVRLVSAEVGGGPAKAIFYRTPTALFIWLAPSKGTGG